MPMPMGPWARSTEKSDFGVKLALVVALMIFLSIGAMLIYAVVSLPR
jgi:hypothetical protein